MNPFSKGASDFATREGTAARVVPVSAPEPAWQAVVPVSRVLAVGTQSAMSAFPVDLLRAWLEVSTLRPRLDVRRRTCKWLTGISKLIVFAIGKTFTASAMSCRSFFSSSCGEMS